MASGLYPLLPTCEEVLQGQKLRELSANIIKGCYESEQQYLDTHFWLLREDFVSPLRKGLSEYREWKRLGGSNFESSYVKYHPNVEVTEQISERGRRKSSIPVALVPYKGRPEQERSKTFMTGSLLCFSTDSFKTLKFATVDFSNHSLRHQTQVGFSSDDIQFGNWKRSYMMLECEAFFAPYLHVLSALESMRGKTIPFKKYLVDVSKEDSVPKYLNCYTTIEVGGVDRSYTFNATKLESWPTAAELGLNESQLVALKTALTAELAVIQGPPGTGKTFLALKIAEILVKNKAALKWRTPILVVCMTNHALDQFLVGMLRFTSKLVRVGGQSKCQQLKAYNLFNNHANLASCDIIGMTTTCAARMKTTLDSIGCQIVIVEEAAEVMEAHILACLSQNLQHLILIGDHKQLRPKVAEYEMERFNLHISLFERMVINREKCCTLQVQHRMAPEISMLIVPLIYENLKDHQSVYNRPQLESLLERVSFVSHDNYETKLKRSTSKRNQLEGEFMVALCKHLLRQIGYTHEDITILTTYNGQLDLIKGLIRNDESKELRKVRVAVVDDFQGEESNIILLSLVRSNAEGNIGFLAKENRVCVALSRAKNALVMVGNMDCLSSRSHLWKSIKSTLMSQDAISDSLTLGCEAHRNHTFKVQNAEDFDLLAPNGGCDQPCVNLLECGHPCEGVCHLPNTCPQCPIPCPKRYGPGKEHACILKCHIASGEKCKIWLACHEHKVEVEEGEPLPELACKNPCSKLNKDCRSDHECPKLCTEKCDLCEIKVTVQRKSGLKVVKMCHQVVPDEEKIVQDDSTLVDEILQRLIQANLK